MHKFADLILKRNDEYENIMMDNIEKRAQIEGLYDHTPNPEYMRKLFIINNYMTKKRKENEELKKTAQNVDDAMTEQVGSVWIAQKVWNEFLTKYPNAKLIAEHISMKKRGTNDFQFEDMPEVLEFMKNKSDELAAFMSSPELSISNDEVIQQKKEELENALKQRGVDTEQIISKYEDDRKYTRQMAQEYVKMRDELQKRRFQDQELQRTNGFYASTISKIYDSLPEDDEDTQKQFIATFFPSLETRIQTVQDGLAFDPNTPNSLSSQHFELDQDLDNENDIPQEFFTEQLKP